MNRKPPVWAWEGATKCPDCGDEVDFFKEEGWEDIAKVIETEHWVVQCFHSHNNPDYPEGRWQIALYQTYKGRQRPPIRKEAEKQKSEDYKRNVEKRRIENNSS